MFIRPSDPVGEFIRGMLRVNNRWVRREIRQITDPHSIQFNFLTTDRSGMIIYNTPSFQLTGRLAALWRRDISQAYIPVKSDILRLQDPAGRQLFEWMEESLDLSRGTRKTIGRLKAAINPLTQTERQNVLSQKLSLKPENPTNGLPPLTKKERAALILEEDATGKGRAIYQRAHGLLNAVDHAQQPPPGKTQLSILLGCLGSIAASFPLFIFVHQLSEGRDPREIFDNFSKGIMLSALTPTLSAALFVQGVELIFG